MKTIVTLCIGNIRKRKIQNGLIVILIMLSTLLLATSITLIQNTENLFEKKHEETNGAHQILTMGEELHDPKVVNKWWDSQKGVTASELIPFKNLSGIKINGKEIPNLYLFMMNTPETPVSVDQLIVIEGKKQKHPQKGTIWIPTSMASSYDISLGEDIEFHTGENTFKLSVSAIVVDMPFGGPFTTNARVWMNEQDYEEQLQAMTGKEKHMMALRFDEYSQSAAYWESFERYLNKPYLESKMEYESIASFYLIINKVIGFVMVFLGTIMMSVSLFIIGFSISDAILSNYKTIGVIKSIGVTSRGIIGVYVMQYGFLSIVSIIPGLLLSSLLSRVIIESSLSFLQSGDSLGNVQGLANYLLIGGTILIIVIITTFFYSRKTRSVDPVQAIRYGMSEAESSKITRRLNNSNRILHSIGLPFQVEIGIKNLSKNMRSSALMILLTTFTSAVLVFGFVLLNSIISIKETAPSWGYDSSNIAVTVFNESAFSKNNFEEYLLSDKRIKNFGWVGELTGVFPSDSSPPLNINISVVEGSYDDFGFENIHGRNPHNKNEIAIGVNVARALKKDVGDVLDVYLGGEKQRLIVTGIYQSIANKSYSARITSEVAKTNTTDIVFINLNDVTQSNQVADELNETFNESISVSTQQMLLDSVFKEAVALLIMPLSLMGILFITVTFIMIFSISRINVRKESSTYGIYKSIGMTSNKIRWSITSGIFILSAVGALFGVVVGVKLLPLVLQNILSQYGLIELPLIINWGMALGISCLSIIAACLSCWLSTSVISKTSPRILIVE
ncbi:ABC transporter permease [Cytobacillus praedii]|uniref:ABC transporter permease n=1 Tax=Cytobacillus praedii TaxID=1742358 RepID=UPI002E1ACEF3|nr:FtsX-like permease family protein [Cytobacillus praedii]MED3574309.1 FtsX-like permease family protein [Cytobacillus praedii]